MAGIGKVGGRLVGASVAQLVERHLAKVNVEGSNPFTRSITLRMGLP